MAIVTASRSELLEWINTYFDVNYTKIEQCGNGEVYCLIFNALFPNTINISKLNKNPKNDYNILNNYKLLQNGFNKCKISRDVNVERLMKCRLQDNLEFLQWFGKLWCEHNPKFVFNSSTDSRPNSRRTSSIHDKRRITSSSSSNNNTNTNTKTNTTNTSTTTVTPHSSIAKTKQPLKSSNQRSTSRNSTNNNQEILFAQLEEENRQLEESVKKASEYADNIQVERNFYFEKLRAIEDLCSLVQQQQEEDSNSILLDDFLNDIVDILYSTTSGFAIPTKYEQSDLIINDNENQSLITNDLDIKENEITNEIDKNEHVHNTNLVNIDSKNIHNENILDELNDNQLNYQINKYTNDKTSIEDNLFDDETF